MFKNLKIEKRNTKVFIIKTKNKVIKFFFSVKSWQEARAERLAIEKVKKDPHFSLYLLEYKYIFGCGITTRLLPLKEARESEELIKKYFQKAFRGSDSWQKTTLIYLTDNNFFSDFMEKYAAEAHGLIMDFMKSYKISISSAHSDFHEKNILADNKKLYFIDWSRYRLKSSRYFDLLDFYIYSRGKKYEPWMQVWAREYNQGKDAILGIKLPKECFLAYAIWRTVEELKKLAAENGLDKYKRKKYLKFINTLTEIINKKINA